MFWWERKSRKKECQRRVEFDLMGKSKREGKCSKFACTNYPFFLFIISGINMIKAFDFLKSLEKLLLLVFSHLFTLCCVLCKKRLIRKSFSNCFLCTKIFKFIWIYRYSYNGYRILDFTLQEMLCPQHFHNKF